MTLELVIFIIVAAVAIFAAAFMLVSRNAVHSALFLVTNFLCVAFFYLMLNAPFLTMIQVTVYAGAIMVLFMFVIMLLGAERLRDEEPRYPWLAPAAVGLTTIFLIVAFVAVAQSNVGLLKPVPPAPQVRVVNAVPGAPALDVYLDNTKVASNVAYRQASDFSEVRAGSHNILVYPACTEADRTKCTDPIKSGAAPILATPATLDPAWSVTFIVLGTPDQLRLMAVNTDVSTLENEDTVRLTAVNALPDSGTVRLASVDPVDNTKYTVLADNLSSAPNAPTAPAQTVVLPQGTYDLTWQSVSGDTVTRIIPVSGVTLRNKTHEMLILAPEIPAGQQAARPTVIRTPVVRTREAFGSPQQIGQTLLGPFLLPFELVSLLLLVAMVGAIILTREETVRRVRQRLVVSPIVRRINRAAARNPGAESSAD